MMLRDLYYQFRRNLRQCQSEVTSKKWSNPCLVFMGKALVAFLVLYFITLYAQTETYVWQVTSLASVIDPVRRSSCVLPSPNVAHNGRHLEEHTYSFHPHPHNHSLRGHESGPNRSTSSAVTLPATTLPKPQSDRPPRIGILLLYSNSDGNWGKALMDRVIKNREDYAARHNYVVVTANDMLDKSRPAAWSKLRAVDHYLHNFDYIAYIDMDVVIMNSALPLSVFIDLQPNADFIMTEDWNGINTGVWITKNTPFARWFLQTAWNQTQLIPKKSPEGISYPFEYEQRAFHFLLNTDIWRKRHLPHYRGDIDELRRHFFLLPQCAMNSYIMYPFYWNGDREKSHYIPGDFLVHFAGKKGRIKTNLMTHFLNVAQEQEIERQVQLSKQKYQH